MVNSRIILTAILAAGTVVLAIPVAPTGVTGIGITEGTLPPPSEGDAKGVSAPGGSHPGVGDTQVGLSEPNLFESTAAQRQVTSAEGRSGPKQLRSFDRRGPNESAIEFAWQRLNVVKNYSPLHENYQKMVEQNEKIMKAYSATVEETQSAIENGNKIVHLSLIIEHFVQKNGPKGKTNSEILGQIREGFKNGEDVDKLWGLAVQGAK
ncbi:hypothetical protein C8J55DRAFT_493441 [Lentinula edodes]|uniref:Uncharacterized protein n=1 Tax=Lentinula lateritia TaxID=40482 RepID=A0A9W9DEK4_9AGAR|nr:hypothetical protein C8J55DRAFT_493441 [Lentinula edodes]